MLADAVIETDDRITGKLYRSCERLSEAKIAEGSAAANGVLAAFAEIGGALIAAKGDDASLDDVIARRPGWDAFQSLVASAASLTNPLAADPMAHVLDGHPRFRRYAPRMLALLDIEASPAEEPPLEAVRQLRSGRIETASTGFLRPGSKWHRHLRAQPEGDHRLWETAVLFHLRDAFRSGDVWLVRSRRYGDLKQSLVAQDAVASRARLAVPLDLRLKALGRAARASLLPGAAIENGVLRIELLAADAPAGAEDLVLALYKEIPRIRITDLMLEVDAATGFAEAFTHLRTGAPCADRIGLLNVILAEGVNLGLGKMAEATNTHGLWELIRIARWHLEGEAYARALALIVEAQAQLPMAKIWGFGLSASSDGQFFAAGEQGEAMNLVNAKYGHSPGLKAGSDDGGQSFSHMGKLHPTAEYQKLALPLLPAPRIGSIPKGLGLW